MWIYVFMGNALRGIGDTPVTPLGISYIDDFAKPENSPFYIGKTRVLLLRLVSCDVASVFAALCPAACLHTVTLLGPTFGFLLGSYCAKLYVDFGHVDTGTVSVCVCSPLSRDAGAHPQASRPPPVSRQRDHHSH